MMRWPVHIASWERSVASNNQQENLNYNYFLVLRNDKRFGYSIIITGDSIKNELVMINCQLS